MRKMAAEGPGNNVPLFSFRFPRARIIKNQSRKLKPSQKLIYLFKPAQIEQKKAKRGRPINTLPRLLWVEAGKIIKVPTLDKLERIAKDRRGWWEFSEKVVSKSFGIQGKKSRKAKVAAYASNKKEYVACSGQSVVTARF